MNRRAIVDRPPRPRICEVVIDRGLTALIS